MRSTGLRTILVFSALLSAPLVPGQAPPPEPDGNVDAAERTRVIDGALAQLRSKYVYADKAAEMEVAIRARCSAREFDGVNNARNLASILTEDLRDVCHDLHLGLYYSASPIPDIPEDVNGIGNPSDAETERRSNFGFEGARVLPGNIGYINLLRFSGLPQARPTGIAAMNFVANADALIIDLRNNRGGSTDMSNLLSSYLFDGVVHLGDIYFRTTGKSMPLDTAAEVVGYRFGSAKPLFILTSHKTFSCAEGFTFALKSLGRATVVGETTGGGAHPVSNARIDSHFGILVPTGRVTTPHAKGDWEGTGIEPDVKVQSGLAVKTANLLALDRILATTPSGPHRDFLERTRLAVSQYKATP
jgi:hypothetical protein